MKRNGLEWSLKNYSILLWWVFLDDHIDELISVLVDQLDALFVDWGGQAVAKDVKSLLDLRLVGLVLQKRKNSLRFNIPRSPGCLNRGW